MQVDLFERKGKQIVPESLLNAPLFSTVPLMEIKSIHLRNECLFFWVHGE